MVIFIHNIHKLDIITTLNNWYLFSFSNKMNSTEESGVKSVTKSAIVIDVKPWDEEVSLDAMEACVRSIRMPGLTWGASSRKLVAAFYKLRITAITEPEFVSIDDLEDKVLEFEEHVQSFDIYSANNFTDTYKVHG